MGFFVHQRTSRRDKSKGSWEHELRRRFWELGADVVHVVSWMPGTCRNCGEVAGELHMVRCGFCEKLAFPRLMLFCGCGNCGGGGKATLLWSLHINDTHRNDDPPMLPVR